MRILLRGMAPHASAREGWKNPFICQRLQNDPATNRRVIRLVECPYAQVVCYKCVAKGSGSMAVKETFWIWECLLREKGFTEDHSQSKGHLEQLSYLQGQDHMAPDVRNLTLEKDPFDTTGAPGLRRSFPEALSDCASLHGSCRWKGLPRTDERSSPLIRHTSCAGGRAIGLLTSMPFRAGLRLESRTRLDPRRSPCEYCSRDADNGHGAERSGQLRCTRGPIGCPRGR